MAENKKKSIKIEVSLLNTIEQTNEYLNEILNQVDIARSDLSVSYEFSEQDLIEKLIIIFQSNEEAEKFKDYIEITENMERYKFKSVDISQCETELTRRFSTCSTDSFQFINEDKQTEYIEAIPGDCPSFNNMEDNILPSLPNNSVHTNNILEFYFDKEIRDVDLDIILLFLENLRKSGGGEYVDYTLDSKKRLLNVEYKSHMNKIKVLNKRFLQVKIDSIEYNINNIIFDSIIFDIIANEPLDIQSFKQNNMVIILRNIQDSWLRDEIINLYAENLVLNDDSSNDVAKITKSLIFPNTVYVQYKHNFDLELLKKRYEKKNILNKIKIEYLQAFASKIVLVGLFDKNTRPISKDLIEMYFTNKRRSGSNPYLSIHEREPFLLLSYDSQENCEAICSKAHKIGEHELVVECLYNYELFENYIKEFSDSAKINLAEQAKIIENDEKKLEIKNLKEEENKDKEIVQSKDETLHKLIDKNNNQENKVDEKIEPKIEDKPIRDSEKMQEINPQNMKVEKLEFKKPYFKIDSVKEPKIKLLKIFQNFSEHLAKQLNDVQSSLELNTLNDRLELNCECTHDLPSVLVEYKEVKKKWQIDIENLIKKFFEQFKIENIKIENPNEVLKNVQFDNSKVNLKKLDDLEQNSFYEIAGYDDDVDNLIIKIQEEENSVPLIVDQIEGLKLYQIRILFVVKYIRKLKEKYPNLQVVIKHKSLKISLKGRQKEIDDAKLLCTNILNKINYRDLALGQRETKFVANREVDVLNWLKEKNLECVLMADNDRHLVRMYYIDFEPAKTCKNEIESIIIVREISKELRQGISDEYTRNFIQMHSNDERVYLEEENDVIYLSGFKTNVEELFSEFIRNSL